MRKEISFFILSNNGSPVKQISLSGFMLYFVGLLIAGIFLVMSYGIYDYQRLKKTEADTKILQGALNVKSEEILLQKEQIKNFASEINSLKAKLVDLNEFEKKIRIIANLEDNSNNDGLFGIGGIIQENLYTNIPADEKYTGLIREMHDQTQELQLASVSQEKSFKSLLDSLNLQLNILASTPTIRPTEGWVTSNFGWRESPFTGQQEFHKGLDIANRIGTPIISTADGTVAFAGTKGLIGKMVLIDHGHGIVTKYGHLHKILVKPGQRVKRGDKIATIGQTGRTTGPHLHYEVSRDGLPRNPLEFILN